MCDEHRPVVASYFQTNFYGGIPMKTKCTPEQARTAILANPDATLDMLAEILGFAGEAGLHNCMTRYGLHEVYKQNKKDNKDYYQQFASKLLNARSLGYDADKDAAEFLDMPYSTLARNRKKCQELGLIPATPKMVAKKTPQPSVKKEKPVERHSHYIDDHDYDADFDGLDIGLSVCPRSTRYWI